MSSDSTEAVTPDSGSGERRATDRFAWLMLAAALLLGLLRFVRLGEWSLWIDEVLTWGDAHSGLKSNYNDLGYVLIRWTVELTGGDPTEAALRVLPALAGYLAVPLTWWAFRPLAGDRRAALAALVVAVSAWQIQWSQTARFYTFVEATTLIGIGVAVRGMAASRWPWIVLGIAFTGAGIVFQLQAAIVAGAVGVCAAVVSPFGPGPPRRAAYVAFLLFAIPGLLALPKVLGVWAEYAGVKALDNPIGGVAHFVFSTGSYLTPALGTLALGGLVILLVERDRRGVFVALVPAVGIVALAGLASTAKVSAQYAFAFFPWIALLAAWPVDSNSMGRKTAVAVAWAAIAALPLLAGTGLYLTVHEGQRARWKDATALVDARRDPTDVVVAMPATVVEFYLTGGLETDVRMDDAVVNWSRYDPRCYEPYARAGRRMWLVVRRDFVQELDHADQVHLGKFLSERCRFVESFPVFVDARNLSIEVWVGPD